MTEFPYGSAFLSQSARSISVNKNMLSITVMNSKGEKRIIK